MTYNPMDLFDVYPLLNIAPDKALGASIWDEKGNEYLDFYGGHAVISIGHSHPTYVKYLQEQIEKIGFYSNSVKAPLQQQVAEKLGKQSGYPDYTLFFCNSGAEAVENALKLASFHTQKDHVIAFKKGFHGRTSGAVAITDNPKIIAPFNAHHSVSLVEYNLVEIKQIIAEKEVAAIIYEPIQGIAGALMPSDGFIQDLRKVCTENGVILIADEIQVGYGRTGKFFAHQHSNIKADLITVAKGMGNGFPIGGVLISPLFKAKHGLLGTTFGGNHLACSAALAVLDVLEEENILDNVNQQSKFVREQLSQIKEIEELRGRGLMVGIKLPFEVKPLRNALLENHRIFVGVSGDPTVLRILPPLNINQAQCKQFITALKTEIKNFA